MAAAAVVVDPSVEDQMLILGMVDRYATPPAQIIHHP